MKLGRMETDILPFSSPAKASVLLSFQQRHVTLSPKCSVETVTNLTLGFITTKPTLPLTVEKAIAFSSGDICARNTAPS